MEPRKDWKQEWQLRGERFEDSPETRSRVGAGEAVAQGQMGVGRWGSGQGRPPNGHLRSWTWVHEEGEEGELPDMEPELGWEMSHPLPTDGPSSAEVGKVLCTSLQAAPPPTGDLRQCWLHLLSKCLWTC